MPETTFFRMGLTRHNFCVLQIILQPETVVPPWLRKHSQIALYRLCKAASVCPQCFFIKDIGVTASQIEGPVAGGGFSDTYRVSLNEKSLCLKVVRTFQKSDTDRVLKVCYCFPYSLTICRLLRL